MKKVLVELQYFPSIYWFALFFYADKVVIDDVEPFRKQTFRNRAQIQTANKVFSLIVPVHKGKSKHPVTQVTIDFSEDWRRLQWRAIESAYKNAAFFDFYKDDLRDLFTYKEPYLADLSLIILDRLQSLLSFSFKEKLLFRSIEQGKNGLEYDEDWRGAIRPKKNAFKAEQTFSIVPYPQVFGERFGFRPGLSIIDLLFNTGPEAEEILRKMVPNKGHQEEVS